MAIKTRIKHAWNAFADETLLRPMSSGLGPSTSGRNNPQRSRRSYNNERTMVASVYTRIGVDCSMITIRHVQLDDQARYTQDVDSELNKCLTLEPNLDQGPTAFRLDAVTSLFDIGFVALVPVETSMNPNFGNGFDVLELRVGEIVNWYPKHVRVRVYNQESGKNEEVTLPKDKVAIVYNPFYAVMNEPNSTLQRLVRKLSLLDAVDEQSSSGKLDIMIQLPYVIKNDTKKAMAEERRTAIEDQLKGSQYGIAYIDGTEKVTQLNRPAENNLLKQVEYLTNLLYSQLGITPGIMDGTADEAAMINYYNRTIEPLITAFVEAMRRSFLGQGAIERKETIAFFQDPFKLIPLSQLAEIVDKLTRNEVLSSNEVRGILGFKPSTDPKADQLVNSNMPQPASQTGSDLAEVNAATEDAFQGILDTIDELVLGSPGAN